MKVRYIAFDGKQFKTESQCREYEKSFKKVSLRDQFKEVKSEFLMAARRLDLGEVKINFIDIKKAFNRHEFEAYAFRVTSKLDGYVLSKLISTCREYYPKYIRNLRSFHTSYSCKVDGPDNLVIGKEYIIIFDHIVVPSGLGFFDYHYLYVKPLDEWKSEFKDYEFIDKV